MLCGECTFAALLRRISSEVLSSQTFAPSYFPFAGIWANFLTNHVYYIFVLDTATSGMESRRGTPVSHATTSGVSNLFVRPIMPGIHGETLLSLGEGFWMQFASDFVPFCSAT